MSVHQYTAGARTRNVVNIADVGGTGTAYSLTAANSIPSSATDGFKNFNSQKTLHVLIHNNGLDNGGASPVSIAADQIQIWGYNSSLGGKWSELRTVDRTHGANTAQFPKVLILMQLQKTQLIKLLFRLKVLRGLRLELQLSQQETKVLWIYILA